MCKSVNVIKLTLRTLIPDAGRGADAERKGRLDIGDWIEGLKRDGA